MLCKMCIDKPRQWDRYIEHLLFEYREFLQANTKLLNDCMAGQSGNPCLTV